MIGEMDCLGIVADYGKGWRPACYLSCVKELDTSSSVQCRRMGRAGILEYMVQAIGGEFLTELFVN